MPLEIFIMGDPPWLCLASRHNSYPVPPMRRQGRPPWPCYYTPRYNSHPASLTRRQGWRTDDVFFWLGPRRGAWSRPAPPRCRQGWRSDAWCIRTTGSTTISGRVKASQEAPSLAIGSFSGGQRQRTTSMVSLAMGPPSGDQRQRTTSMVPLAMGSPKGAHSQLTTNESALAHESVIYAHAGDATGVTLDDFSLKTHSFTCRIFFHISKDGGNSCKIFKNTLWHIVAHERNQRYEKWLLNMKGHRLSRAALRGRSSLSLKPQGLGCPTAHEMTHDLTIGCAANAHLKEAAGVWRTQEVGDFFEGLLKKVNDSGRAAASGVAAPAQASSLDANPHVV